MKKWPPLPESPPNPPKSMFSAFRASLVGRSRTQRIQVKQNNDKKGRRRISQRHLLGGRWFFVSWRPSHTWKLYSRILTTFLTTEWGRKDHLIQKVSKVLRHHMKKVPFHRLKGMAGHAGGCQPFACKGSFGGIFFCPHPPFTSPSSHHSCFTFSVT